ncbi:hypothetical protein PF002_g19541 [Phytophthora fragariae]|uniref:Uncharacterized protein n=1 Tax=Phytophthora fragariae TaxID=53985 RepID=A0A6A3XVT5_9STRA|nr:hypothetical protein PF002_g19541 [Phytophthora fragariae]
MWAGLACLGSGSLCSKMPADSKLCIVCDDFFRLVLSLILNCASKYTNNNINSDLNLSNGFQSTNISNMVKYATEDVTPTPKQETLVINGEPDKFESGYANMPTTPKATDLVPIMAEKGTGMYRFAVQSVHLRELRGDC